MKTVLAALLVVTGIASQYAPGVMQEVIGVRQRMGDLPQDLPEADCYVARPYDEVGQVVYIRPVGQSEWKKCLVVDCGGVADGGRQWMLSGNVLVEVDYQLAQKWDTVGRAIDIEMLTEQQWRFLNAGPRHETH
jgi:hypothetical protein